METVDREKISEEIDQGIRTIRAMGVDIQAISAALVVLKLWEQNFPRTSAYRNGVVLRKMADICKFMGEKYFTEHDEKWFNIAHDDMEQALDDLIRGIRGPRSTLRG